jgi:hypothetical protein
MGRKQTLPYGRNRQRADVSSTEFGTLNGMSKDLLTVPGMASADAPLRPFVLDNADIRKTHPSWLWFSP